MTMPWINTAGGTTPDLFHACSPPLVFPPDTIPHLGVPENLFGSQFANTGDGYAGIYKYNGPVQEELREYLQVELSQQLHAGVRYRVSFYVSLADKFQYAVGTLGAYFTDALVVNDNWGVYEVDPQIESPVEVVFEDKENWVLVEDTFSSRFGGERFMLIGNFRTDDESQIALVDSNSLYSKSYYYIDDVSVIALDSVPNSIEEYGGIRFSVYPNPTGGGRSGKGATAYRQDKAAGHAWQRGVQ